jgi:hypothetical protein
MLFTCGRISVSNAHAFNIVMTILNNTFLASRFFCQESFTKNLQYLGDTPNINKLLVYVTAYATANGYL